MTVGIAVDDSQMAVRWQSDGSQMAVDDSQVAVRIAVDGSQMAVDDSQVAVDDSQMTVR
jgi:hypothetical protein